LVIAALTLLPALLGLLGQRVKRCGCVAAPRTAASPARSIVVAGTAGERTGVNR
jgi:uncharacterized membrane protein YdfJ with MMPL/SSD domain